MAGAQVGVEVVSTEEHCSLAPVDLPYVIQALDSAAHSGVGPFTPISTQENALQVWPQANLMETSLAEVLSSQLCQAGNKDLLSQKVSTGLATLATVAG